MIPVPDLSVVVAEVREARLEVARERSRRRWQVGMCLAALAVSVTAGASATAEQRRRTVALCQEANVNRATIRDSFGILVAVAGEGEQTEQERDQAARFIEAIHARTEPARCG